MRNDLKRDFPRAEADAPGGRRAPLTQLVNEHKGIHVMLAKSALPASR